MSRREGTQIGAVKLYAPTGTRPYFRIVYRDASSKRREMGAGTEERFAVELALATDQELAAAAAGPNSVSATPAPPADLTLGSLVEEYVSTARDRKRDKSGRATGEDWQENHHGTVARDLRRAISGVENARAADVDCANVDHMRSACGTPGMVEQMTGRARLPVLGRGVRRPHRTAGGVAGRPECGRWRRGPRRKSTAHGAANGS